MSFERVLVVDDEPEIRRLLQEILQDEDYVVEIAANAAQARVAVKREQPDVVLLDIWMPDEDGVTLLKHWNAQGPLGFTVIMMSGHGTVETAVEATRHGAFDYIEKPLSLSRLLLTVRRGIETAKALRRPFPAFARDATVSLIGTGMVMRRLREEAQQRATRHDWLLVGGEAGSGRDTFLRYLHAHGPRRAGAFVDLSEARWAPALERALQHAQAEALEEAVRAAQGGLLCLGELLRLRPSEQAALLALLDTVDPQTRDIRIAALAASDMPPAAMVEAGRMAPSVARRFEAGYVRVPTLHEHAEDVPELLQYHAERLHREEGLVYRQFTVAAQNRLRHHRWPGNVSELVGLVRHLLNVGHGGEVDIDEADAALEALPTDASQFGVPAYEALLALPLKDARERFERAYLTHWLAESDGNISRLAEQAGIERTHLYRKLRALGIDLRRDRHKPAQAG
ncbi:sigma-54-dependent transcriptional regulator [Acidihalobacter ferrooxydans]|uniref:Transcriptional regulator n=1 Tax=Acidihalobacter ferrooxydans TaxID=1765967 RepID=A0A1P8UKQ8_9GAMM|nr:response regulator [Acidihalobacter ferrooxydans]APZ44372.1 hypothetical protein BW247_15815 [Acidihalobacter ferrooxydans]